MQIEDGVGSSSRERLRRSAVSAITSSSAIRSWETTARQFNTKVTIVPTSVDTSRYRVRSERHSRNGHRPLVVGWTGSSTSQTYLEWFAPVLREMVSKGGIEFRVHSNRKPELSGIPFEWRPWSPETEVDEISQFDVGIMPMPDTDWARGKCAMKALLYMSVGVPAICSDIGANRDVITNGVNGFLASTKDDWIAHTMIVDERSDSSRQTCSRGAQDCREGLFDGAICKSICIGSARYSKATVKQHGS